MRFHDWIHNIRWKYFTNNKAGLIFKELMKEFRIVYKMTENKRFKLIYNEYQTSNGKTIKAEPYFIDIKEEYVDEVYFTINGYPTMSDEQVVDLLNKQEELIETLKEDVEIILDYVLNKWKFAMTVEEQKAHNRLRGFVRGDVE